MTGGYDPGIASGSWGEVSTFQPVEARGEEAMNEYKPLHKLILDGLEEGTVLERNNGVRTRYTWDGRELRGREGYLCLAPEDHKWRVISTPLKKIEFEAKVKLDDDGDYCLYLPDDHKFEDGTPVRVTVEEKRP